MLTVLAPAVTSPASSHSSMWAAAAVVLAALVAMGPAVGRSFAWDDQYVLAHASSASWHTRAFAFDVDHPAPENGSWWDGIHVQRRFIRIPSSLLLWAQVRLFEGRAVPLHAVNLALHALASLLLFRLLRRRLEDATAAMAGAVLFAVHPAAVEIVGWWCCQPLALAAVFSLLAVDGLFAWERSAAPAGAVRVVLFTLLAITSYEAVAGLPVLLWLLCRKRWLLLNAAGAWTLLGLLSVLNRAGVVAPDTSFRPTVAEAWRIARVDAGNYVLKMLGLVSVREPMQYTLYNAWGELACGALIFIPLVLCVLAAKRSRKARFGLFAFAVLLAPPFLIRVFAAVLNRPTFRQLYLPLLGMALLVAVGAGRQRWRVALAACLAVFFFALDWRLAKGVSGNATLEAVGARVRGLLEREPVEKPVVVVGTFAACGYSVRYEDYRREEARLVPPTRDESRPTLTRTGPRSFLAESQAGFDIPLKTKPRPPISFERYESGGRRLPLEPPPLIAAGTQSVPGARIEIVRRDDERLTALHFVLERELDDVVFLFAANDCERVERMDL